MDDYLEIRIEKSRLQYRTRKFVRNLLEGCGFGEWGEWKDVPHTRDFRTRTGKPDNEDWD